MFDSISDKFSSILRTLGGKSKITEKNIQDAVEEIKMALLDADVNLRVVRRFVNATMEEALGEKVLKAVDPSQQFVKIVHDRMVGLLGDEESQKLNLRGPDVTTTILMMGLQGSGKTTTAAKLALRLKKPATVEYINVAFGAAAKGYLKGILDINYEPLVSSDYKGMNHSSAVDALSTMVVGGLTKVLAWYDNEWGYCCRLVDLISFIASKGL